jgi:predicted RNase H-like HicB family nuclease
MSRLLIASPRRDLYPVAMRNRYSAVLQRDGKWFTAFCPEVPEANGQGKTREECLQSLAAAIELVVDHKRERSLENAPKGAEQTSVLV